MPAEHIPADVVEALTHHGSASIPEAMSSKRTLWTVYAVNFLNATGMWFFLPLLPIFLGRKGGSAALVGVVFAAGLAANALIRYPAGWAAQFLMSSSERQP